MRYIADLHIHSRFSRATSKALDLEHIHAAAMRKGVAVVGTGDFTHPAWLEEIREKLVPAEPGLLRLRDDLASAAERDVPAPCLSPVRFILSVEISNIYKKGDRVRKVHNLILSPDVEAAARLQAALERIGNIRSDGRPILGLDSRDLLEIVLESSEQACLIPAHIWTPWFSALGSKSGFDSIEECYGDLTDHIFAVETGLSSDPLMNWRCAQLDRFFLVSNSDAHSAEKIGREANLFDTELSYFAMVDALRAGDPARALGTIEFFPEQGKYHYDGHRKCGTRMRPAETVAAGGLCPGCGKPVTVGVMHRVEVLADRPAGERPAGAASYHSLVSLNELVGGILDVGPGSKKVARTVAALLGGLGPELHILMEAPLEDVGRAGGEVLAEGVKRIRTGEVTIAAGYDGEYGTVSIFDPGEREQLSGQMALALGSPAGKPGKTGKPDKPDKSDKSEKTRGRPKGKRGKPVEAAKKKGESRAVGAGGESGPQKDLGPLFARPARSAWSEKILDRLNPEQRQAVTAPDGTILIVAGPGTGKTYTLTCRIAYLIRERGVQPSGILAVTFTNKAAEEMADRLALLLDEPGEARSLTICTFHALGLEVLRAEADRIGRTPDFTIYDDEERLGLIRTLESGPSAREARALLDRISRAKRDLVRPGDLDGPDGAPADEAASYSDDEPFAQAYRAYEEALRRSDAVDFDDLIGLMVRLFESDPEVLARHRDRFQAIFIDEYQDINRAQYRLVRLLAPDRPNLCAIGDPDQAIYGFRGAEVAYFHRFAEDFPEARVIRLTRSYRSTETILGASTEVIEGAGRIAEREGPGERDKTSRAGRVWSGIEGEGRIHILRAPTDRAEAEFVVHQIERALGGTSYFSLDSGRLDSAESAGGGSFSDFVVLYRLGAQAAALVEAFERSGIPYQRIGTEGPFASRGAKAVLALLRLFHNPASELDLVRSLRFRGGSGDRSALEAFASSGADGGEGTLSERLEAAAAREVLRQADRSALADLSRMMRVLESIVPGPGVAELIGAACDSYSVEGGEDCRGGDSLEAGSRVREALLSCAKPYGRDLGGYLSSAALRTGLDAYDPRAERVVLMTLHASKGLEFPVVFIVGCEDGILPYRRPGEELSTEDFEEERRLLYVGMTRAMSRLYLCSARSRTLYGERREPPESPFLADIRDELKEAAKTGGKRRRPKVPNTQMDLF